MPCFSMSAAQLALDSPPGGSRGRSPAMQRSVGDWERSMPQRNSRPVITRDQYDAVLLDLDGVITDTASMHAACWKQMFDEYLQKARNAERRSISTPSISPRTTGSMWMGSLASTVFATFSHHAASNSPREPRTTLRRLKQWVGSGTARTSWSTRSLKTRGSSLTREALNSSISSARTGSKSPSSPRARTARPF